MINAIVQNKQGETAVIDLTVHYHEIYKELQSLGYYGSPERLLLRDEEDEEYSVKLYSDSDIGNSMILLLNERDSLYDAYLLDLAVTNAREEIKTDLEQNLLHEQYTTFSEVLDDINQMKIEAAETKLTFFCPLEATIYDDEGYYSPASNYTISDNRDKIEDMLGIEQLPDLGDMAEYVGEHSGIGNKLIYAVWGLEEISGEVYGKIDCYCADAKTINPDEMPDLDLICAGFPCQSFSVAGKRLGFADTRGTLFFEVARIAESKRPAFLLLENVPGLLSHDGGRTLDTIFSALVELGYNLEWCVLNSKYFGVPQQRRRLFIVGYRDGRCAGQIFPLDCGDAKNLKQLIPGPQGQRVYETDGIACTQCAGSGGWGGKTGLYFIDMNPDPQITDVARCITARQDSGVSNHRGEHSAVLIEDAPRAILTPDRETVRQQGRRVKEPDEAMFTITAQDRHGIWHKGRIRRLMPIECWRLQGYTDEQFNKAQATGLTDGRLYKMAGNSVTVPVISAIGQKIRMLDEKYNITGGNA